MKHLLITFLVILNLIISAQTTEEINMINQINTVRTNPKSFIPVVESYIKDLESKGSIDTTKFNMKYVKIKSRHNQPIESKRNDTLIAEAKRLITFLKIQKPVKALSMSSKLYTIATAQVIYMDSIKTLTHNGPDGNKRYTKGFILSGENCSIGKNYTEALLVLLIDFGNERKGHRTNIFLKDL